MAHEGTNAKWSVTSWDVAVLIFFLCVSRLVEKKKREQTMV